MLDISDISKLFDGEGFVIYRNMDLGEYRQMKEYVQIKVSFVSIFEIFKFPRRYSEFFSRRPNPIELYICELYFVDGVI